MQKLETVYQNLNSNNLEQCVQGIYEAIAITDDIASKLIGLLKSSDFDKLIITELISQLFSKYLKELSSYVESNDASISFWSAALLVHYSENLEKANKILLDAVENSEPESAFVALTILRRKRNNDLVNAIKNRLLHSEDLSEEMKKIFEESLHR